MDNKPKYWLSPVPGFCETCDGPIRDKFYDAKTTHGPWACMCPMCFHFGPGVGRIGTGLGQEYTKSSDGKWYKTGG